MQPNDFRTPVLCTTRKRMTPESWTAVDQYLNACCLAPDAVLDDVAAACTAAGLPEISVTPNQGKLLGLLARMQQATKILEIGTLGGYSAIWLARALPAGGRLITLEAEPLHAQVARENFRRAGLEDRIELRLGAALDTLPQLEREGCGPFDMIFIDADKPSNPAYFSWALKLARPGPLVIIAHVVRGGDVLDAQTTDDKVQGVQRLLALINKEPRVSATAIQTVGSKGYDGMAVMLVE